ncbi:CmpA/NrtA family ABC transporter substrate-binding protein [Pseudoxanthomonas wuyuanensis]|uniref:Nitrate/nitrite transport system substrate-binding protein n=1 Tax=Pseudoxanthomonas wuyuanensis TaxID=1073196 RepID=A0A286CZ24_9GAMM|nr:CmpA/NrtA family ABC transporter substrate-binding protein [Pseudoxanthomonas wuyuanensis]KAF1722271.1 nitrate ABC transporter substrate-binding protein [Pseudoxanthomonas wuyuanensis]SOD51657.1 nitrate/nitrite transport system substrate-binding protein [Pseudoxanthomonas wuyuanensis]
MTGHDNRDIRTLRLGYMPLIDCAPLVAAVRLGLDSKHGLQLQLQRQASWAAIRDKLLSGELDAVHALAGLVYGVETGIGGPQAELAILLTLNQNGQAITLSPALAQQLEQGVPLREALAALPRRPVFAQTFPTGTHAMWLYYWLAAQGVDPMADIRGVTLPPPQMPAALARGELDGYCAGEPWAAQAEALGAGKRVIRSGQIWPGHPEKVLACRREFAALHPETAVALTAALLEACRWLDEPGNRRQAVDWLADPDVIDLPAERIAACLLPVDSDPPGQGLRFHADGQVNFPWQSDGRWFLQQFRRWGLLPDGAAAADDALLGNVHRLQTYRQAAAQLGVALPAADTRQNLLFDSRLR